MTLEGLSSAPFTAMEGIRRSHVRGEVQVHPAQRQKTLTHWLSGRLSGPHMESAEQYGHPRLVQRPLPRPSLSDQGRGYTCSERTPLLDSELVSNPSPEWVSRSLSNHRPDYYVAGAEAVEGVSCIPLFPPRFPFTAWLPRAGRHQRTAHHPWSCTVYFAASALDQVQPLLASPLCGLQRLLDVTTGILNILLRDTQQRGNSTAHLLLELQAPDHSTSLNHLALLCLQTPRYYLHTFPSQILHPPRYRNSSTLLPSQV